MSGKRPTILQIVDAAIDPATGRMAVVAAALADPNAKEIGYSPLWADCEYQQTIIPDLALRRAGLQWGVPNPDEFRG